MSWRGDARDGNTDWYERRLRVCSLTRTLSECEGRYATIATRKDDKKQMQFVAVH